ncbi:MAG: hypothetical protein LC667_07010, partial [Thioalkalivibrio sp.]|nr:hypothetical protein [Thioalkalivibrio sp.]
DYELLNNVLRQIGRGVVFIAPSAWSGSSNLALQHLGDTEGEIKISPNESFVHLTTPELTGAAKRESYLEGADPVVELPLYVATPELRALLSPVDNAGAGHGRRRKVKSRTLVIFPEELFFDEDTASYETLSYSAASGWSVNGKVLTAEQERLLGLAVWLWRGYFTAPAITFRHADAGKSVESAQFQVQHAEHMPDGHKLYSIGDPDMHGIEIEPAPVA